MSPLLGLRSPDPRCRVCGCHEVVLDYAAAAPTAPVPIYALELGQCPRCDHRWTRPLRLPTQDEVQRAVAVRTLSGSQDAFPNAA